MTRDKICVTLHYYHKSPDRKEVMLKRAVGHNSVGVFLTQMRRLSSVSYYGKFVSKTDEGRRFILKTNLFKIISHIPLGLRKKIFKFLDLTLGTYQKTILLYLIMPERYIGKFKEEKYYGVSYKVPELPEEYLEKHYGNWRKPPENPEKWDWTACGSWIKIEKGY